jgi:EAL domain-containing protein (putative c-di-GMP-specific phosphodiesterase class I)
VLSRGADPSLAYLRELPVDEPKIDRAFIARAELTGEDLALARPSMIPDA